jgi:hypothetical protein
MDKQGFTALLRGFNFPEEGVTNSLAIAEKFEAFLGESGKAPTAETAWDFSRLLIKEKKNTWKDYFPLIQYSRFIKNRDMFAAFMELIDGGEVGDNLYRGIGEKFGVAVRNEIYNGIGKCKLGTPTPEKPAFIHPILRRLEKKVGAKASKEFLSAGLRTLPARMYQNNRKEFLQAGDIDTYLKQQKDAFVNNLEDCKREGEWWFVQEITEDVIAFVRANPEIGAGRREGKILYETKIPYMAKEFLAAGSSLQRRYYACHCPWAREALKNGDVKLSKALCHCSSGFMKKPWEAIFRQPLKVDILESVLNGDERCRFAIHLPAEAVKKAGDG